MTNYEFLKAGKHPEPFLNPHFLLADCLSWVYNLNFLHWWLTVLVRLSVTQWLYFSTERTEKQFSLSSNITDTSCLFILQVPQFPPPQDEFPASPEMENSFSLLSEHEFYPHPGLEISNTYQARLVKVEWNQFSHPAKKIINNLSHFWKAIWQQILEILLNPTSGNV